MLKTKCKWYEGRSFNPMLWIGILLKIFKSTLPYDFFLLLMKSRRQKIQLTMVTIFSMFSDSAKYNQYYIAYFPLLEVSIILLKNYSIRSSVTSPLFIVIFKLPDRYHFFGNIIIRFIFAKFNLSLNILIFIEPFFNNSFYAI